MRRQHSKIECLITVFKDFEFRSQTCDETCAAKECPDAIICSDSRSPQLEIAVHAGEVVDAIEVNDKRFGNQIENNNRKLVSIASGEKIQLLKYGIGRHPSSPHNNGICGLYFITDAGATIGEYAYDCPTEYNVTIPKDMTFPEFLKQEITYIGVHDWVSGFRNRVPTESKVLSNIFS